MNISGLNTGYLSTSFPSGRHQRPQNNTGHCHCSWLSTITTCYSYSYSTILMKTFTVEDRQREINLRLIRKLSLLANLHNNRRCYVGYVCVHPHSRVCMCMCVKISMSLLSTGSCILQYWPAGNTCSVVQYGYDGYGGKAMVFWLHVSSAP